MKAITVRQPWATLIAQGEKKFETRGRRINYRGPLAIHAGKQIDHAACEREPIKSTLAKYGYTADNLPTGAVVATAQLAECWKVERLESVESVRPVELRAGTRIKLWAGYLKEDKELHFGDYSDGRYAWELTDVKRLEQPIPAKGQQGLWTWNEAGE